MAEPFPAKVFRIPAENPPAIVIIYIRDELED